MSSQEVFLRQSFMGLGPIRKLDSVLVGRAPTAIVARQERRPRPHDFYHLDVFESQVSGSLRQFDQGSTSMFTRQDLLNSLVEFFQGNLRNQTVQVGYFPISGDLLPHLAA
jgi:hypothetical protein